MRPQLHVLALLAVLAVPATGAERLLAIDFGAAGIASSASGKGSFSGPLPPGCFQDFTGWNSSIAHSATGADDDRRFLRLSVERIDQAVQFRMPIAKVRLPGHFRLTLRLRIHDSAPMVALRQVPAPYETLWSAPLGGPPGTWSERTIVFAVDRTSAVPIGLLLYPGTGDCDLAGMALDQLTTEEFAGTVRRPASGGNLLGARHFPLGLPSGWSVGSDAPAALAAPAGDATSPAGFPPLRFTAPAAATLYSVPFQVADPLAGQVARIACRATGSWTVQVASRTAILAEQRINASPEWQRIAMPFRLAQAERLSPGFHLRFSGSGDLLLDAVSVASESATETDEPEVALAVTGSELADLRTAFADEPAQVAFAVIGDCPDAVLRLRTTDAWGAVRDLPAIRLDALPVRPGSGRPLRRGLVDAGAGAEAPLGQVRWEARLEQDGRQLGAAAELLVTRIRRPRTDGQDAPQSPFGIHVAPAPRQLRLARAAGATWARFHDALQPTAWAAMEPERDGWTFHDDEIRLFRDHHFMIYAGLSTAPRWASTYRTSGKTDVHRYFDQYFQPDDLDAWRTYVTTVVSRYRGQIGAYFLWNEPWGRGFWHTGWDAGRQEYIVGPSPARDYAALSAIAYRAAKAADPSVAIVGFNTASGDWTRGVLDAGGMAHCDAIDYHYYSTVDQALPGDAAECAFRAAIGPVRERHPSAGKPVIMSEGQGNSNGMNGMEARTGMHRLTLPWDSDEIPLLTADRTCRFMVANLAAGADKVFLYSMHGFRSLLSGPSLGVLVGADGFPHLELAAYSNLAWQIEGRRWRRSLPFADGSLIHLFADASGTTAVVAGRRSARRSIAIPRDAEAFDLFGNRLRPPVSSTGFLWYIRTPADPDRLARVLLDG